MVLFLISIFNNGGDMYLCACKDSCKLLNKINLSLLLAIIAFVSGLVFMIKGMNSSNGEAFYTAASSMFIAATFLYGKYTYSLDAINKTSEFYLKQIIKYFSNGHKLIGSDNNNIKWHQGIDSLKTSVKLSKRLGGRSHQEIYVMEYTQTAYSILESLKRINNYKFFAGQEMPFPPDANEDWKKQNEARFKQIIKDETSAISPGELSYLLQFIGRINIHFQREYKGEMLTLEEKFNDLSNPVFKKIINREDPMFAMMKLDYEPIFYYISMYYQVINNKQ